VFIIYYYSLSDLVIVLLCSFLDLPIFFSITDTATTKIYTLSLHDALPIFVGSLGTAVTVTGSPTQKSATPVVVGASGTSRTVIVSVADDAVAQELAGTS